MLQKQALESADARAARDERRAMYSGQTAKRYRLGPQNPDGTIAIDVADHDAENWRQREMCSTLQQAERRLKQLSAEETELPSTPDV
jgi:hypothetical protein